MGDRPFRHEPAVAPSADPEALRIGDPARDERVDSVHQVLVGHPAPIADGRVHLPALAGDAPRVGEKDDVTPGREELAPRPPGRHPTRPPGQVARVRRDDRRIRPAGFVVGRSDQDSLALEAVLRVLPSHALHRARTPASRLRIQIRQPAGGLARGDPPDVGGRAGGLAEENGRRPIGRETKLRLGGDDVRHVLFPTALQIEIPEHLGRPLDGQEDQAPGVRRPLGAQGRRGAVLPDRPDGPARRRDHGQPGTKCTRRGALEKRDETAVGRPSKPAGHADVLAQAADDRTRAPAHHDETEPDLVLGPGTGRGDERDLAPVRGPGQRLNVEPVSGQQ